MSRTSDENTSLIATKTYNYVDGKDAHPSSVQSQTRSCWRHLNNLFFHRVAPILTLGDEKVLTDDDLDEFFDIPNSAQLYDKISHYNSERTSIFKVLIGMFWKQMLCISSLRLPFLLVTIAQPLLLYQIVRSIDDRSLIKQRYIYGIALFICASLGVVIFHQYYFWSLRLDLLIRNSFMSIIYARLLGIRTVLLEKMTINFAFNMIANDLTKFEESFECIVYLVEGPIVAIMIFFCLYWIIGLWPTVCGYVALIFLLILQIFFSRQFSRYQEKTLNYTDQRIHIYKELIHGCDVIKINYWQKSFEERIDCIRHLETTSLRWGSFQRAINMGLFFGSMTLIGFATYAGGWWTNHPLLSTEIFIALAFYSQMRYTILYQFLFAVEKLSELKLIWRRIDILFKLITTQERPRMKLELNPVKRKGAITMHNASFRWYEDRPCLSCLNIQIEPGTFVGIVGSVGSGKSSFFAAILGEMLQIHGQLIINESSFSYVAQSGWILADTIRGNILLDKPMNEQRYRDVIEACCLNADLNQMGIYGDLTMIGEQGVNLSGGQKTRLALARALYTDADIYLFDDPFAALDTFVARQISQLCFSSHGFLKNKTRLLITHRREFLDESDQIISFVDGHVQPKEPVEKSSISSDITPDHKAMSLKSFQSTEDTEPIIVDEASNSGTVSWSIWYRFLTAPPSGVMGFYLVILFLFIGEVLVNGTNLWLYYSSPDDQSLLIYFILTIISMIAAIGRAIYFYGHLLNGANDLHAKMLVGLLRTSISFFQANPSGRILNRVSKDQQIVDEILPTLFFDATQLLFMAGGLIIVMSILNPWLSPLFLLVLPLSWILRLHFIRSSCQLSRLQTIARSSICTWFLSSLQGLTTIHAFQVENSFVRIFFDRIDRETRSNILLKAVGRWFGSRIDLIGLVFVLLPNLLSVILTENINPTRAALILFYSLNLISWFQRGARRSVDIENAMISVERLDEYGSLLAEEGEMSQRPSKYSERLRDGTIEFRNYSLRYRISGEVVLNNLNFNIRSEEKIGIIGRTGAGKSSLFQGLLRLVDQSNITGAIFIDHVDISEMTLRELRTRFSVIPQHPTFFCASLRYNLDPMSIYSDEQCWMALEAVQLKKYISEQSAGLHMSIADSGTNVSLGQRQLISIARAILREDSILLIDEATANIDEETDQLLQSVMTHFFQHRTMLIIAHRLTTVKHCDRILLLDRGEVKDFDVPEKILTRFNFETNHLFDEENVNIF